MGERQTTREWAARCHGSVLLVPILESEFFRWNLAGVFQTYWAAAAAHLWPIQSLAALKYWSCSLCLVVCLPASFTHAQC